mgnify:CR=1 FL=1
MNTPIVPAEGVTLALALLLVASLLVKFWLSSRQVRHVALHRAQVPAPFADTITLDVDRPEFKIHGGLWDGRSLHELYQEAQTPYEWHAALFERAAARGVTLFSSPFDETAVDLLAGLDAPAYKIASFEAVDLPLIRHAARQGKPLIISTGMANLAEMRTALDTAVSIFDRIGASSWASLAKSASVYLRCSTGALAVSCWIWRTLAWPIR